MTRKRRAGRRSVAGSTMVLIALIGALLVPTVASAGGNSGAVVVANRASGSISIIETDTLDVSTIDLPGDAEPMYVNHDRKNGTVFVGDRASSTVVAFDDETYGVKDSIVVGDGVFHQWYDDQAGQLWVVGDIANAVTVIDGASLAVVASIGIPTDLVVRGGRPHDVFVTKKRAFVSIIGLDDGTGVVLQYSTSTFAEIGRITTGGDPHLFVTANRLYVASQDAGEVSRYDAKTLAPAGSIPVPSAHGIFVPKPDDILVTNIAGGGTDGLWEVDGSLTSVQDVTDLPFPVPHNITVDAQGRAWVTHSGATADQVSVVDRGPGGFGPPVTIEVGLNPFGLAFVRN